MTRIRYKLSKNIDDVPILISDFLFADLNQYRVVIDNLYYFIHEKSGAILIQSEVKSQQEAKKEVRQHLINLGVKFNKERRIKKDKQNGNV